MARRCTLDLHALLNYGRDGGDKGIRIDRLCNVRLEPGGYRFRTIVTPCVRRDRYRRDYVTIDGAGRTNLPQQLVPVDDRQADIRNEEIRLGNGPLG
jgi:hypothetical protein